MQYGFRPLVGVGVEIAFVEPELIPAPLGVLGSILFGEVGGIHRSGLLSCWGQASRSIRLAVVSSGD